MTKEWQSRVKMWMTALKKRIYAPVGEMEFSYYTTMEHLLYEDGMKGDFQPIATGRAWGREWEYGWFQTRFRLGGWAKGKRVVMSLDLGGESTLFVNGQVFGTTRAGWVDEPLHFLCDNYVTRDGAGDEEILLVAECYAGHSMPPEGGPAAAGPVSEDYQWRRPEVGERTRLGTCTYGIWNEEAYHLLLELQVLLDIWNNGDQDSLRVVQAGEALKEFTMKVDFSLPEEEFQNTISQCREYLSPYMSCVNGTTTAQMHAIGHAHIDLAWFWPLEETERKCARTMAAQIRHMEEYPEYKMLLSQPQLYEMIKAYYPELFDQLKEKAQNGQLIPEGGMWVEADTNVPSGESLVRQFLYGKKYFKEEFGIESQLLWLPDVFGYSGALPQIMKGCGIRYFATAKIFWTYNGGEPFPYHYFNWKGIDGTRLPSFLHADYNSGTDAEFLIKKWKDRRQKNQIKRMLVSIGYGDGGGGCTRDHIEQVRLLRNCEGVPAISFDDPGHFFQQMEQEVKEVPDYVGELYFQAHRGTYTSQALIKRNIRFCELALREAELWSAIADQKALASYPTAEFEENWKILLKNQFHDILPGSSIHKVYETASKELGSVLAFAEGQSRRAAGTLLREVPQACTIFHSLSWEEEALVKLPEGWSGAKDSKGETLAVQYMTDGLYAQAKLPAMGTRVLYSAEAGKQEEEFCVSEQAMENEWLCLQFNDQGEIVSLYDKEGKCQWAAGPLNVMKLYQDVPGSYEAWDIDSMRKEVPAGQSEKARITVTERGPLYCEVTVERQLHHSRMIQRIGLERNSRTVTFHTVIDWQETQKLLKVAFPVNVTTDELVSEIQFGYLKRPNHKSREYDKDRFEVCNHKWSALTEPGRGCAILNDSKYGISCEDRQMELTLLKSAVCPDESADKGRQEFTYAFTFWNTPFSESQVVRRAYELNVKPFVLDGAAEDISLVASEHPGIIIDCVKKAEREERAVVLRMYESMGSRSKTRLQLHIPVKEAYVTNMMEECQKMEAGLPIVDGVIELEFGAFEVKTLMLVMDAPSGICRH